MPLLPGSTLFPYTTLFRSNAVFRANWRHAATALASVRSGPALTLANAVAARSEEHTSELQSLRHLVCRLLLEKKKECARMVTFCPSIERSTVTTLRRDA